MHTTTHTHTRLVMPLLEKVTFHKYSCLPDEDNSGHLSKSSTVVNRERVGRDRSGREPQAEARRL